MTDAVVETSINKSPILKNIYTNLITELKQIGPLIIEPKKTSIHIKAKSAFVGIHPRKDYLIVNIVSDKPIVNNRIFKVEQVSKTRFHNHIKIPLEQDIDRELIGWFKQAYSLMS